MTTSDKAIWKMGHDRWVGDFETLTTSPTRVWGWGLCKIGQHQHTLFGTSIESYVTTLKDKPIVYMHNLKFDGFFIVDFLLKSGYRHSNKPDIPGTFTTLISDMGTWYCIEINNGGFITKIYDSLKKLPMPVHKIAKAFKLPIRKGQLDYSKHRPLDHKLTKDEKDYIENDVQIVAQALEIQIERKFTSMTVGSDALKIYRKTLKSHDFDKVFPQLPMPIDAEIRQSYRGGYVYVNPLYKGQDVGQGDVYDVNSLYPSVMHSPYELPWGWPVSFEGKYEPDPDYPLYIIRVMVAFKIRPGFIPTVQLKRGRYSDHTYCEGTNVPADLTFTSVDWEIFKKHYIITDIKYIGGYKFKSTTGLFDEYIDFMMHKKENTVDGERVIYKLFLNGLYGKFAKSPIVTTMTPVLENEKVRLIRNDVEYGDTLYLPVGSFITAYARSVTIEAAQSMGRAFVYCDTDSLHVLRPHNGNRFITIHPTRLGLWKHEGTFDRARFLRAKTYIEEFEGKLQVTCAGMPDNIKAKVIWENFHGGTIFHGKLMPKRVPGGIILEERTFTIK